MSVGYSGVIGQLNKSEWASKWRFNVQDVKLDAKIEDIFDLTPEVVEFPKEWMDAVNVPAPTVFVPQYGRQHYGRGGSNQGYSFGLGLGLDDDFSDYGVGFSGRGSAFPKEGTRPASEINATNQAGRVATGERFSEGVGRVGNVTDLLAFPEVEGIEGLECIVDDLLHDGQEIILALDSCDEALLSIIKDAYEHMTKDGQLQLQTNGL